MGIGFGMQAIVNNFLSGLILIFSRTLQEEDVVEVGGLIGTVRKISVRATTVETRDHAVIYVPNAEFVSSRLVNWTRNSRSVCRAVKVGVAYGTDTELVSQLLLGAIKNIPHVLTWPAPSVAFTEFGSSTLDFELRFWVSDFIHGGSAPSAARFAIEKNFRQHNVEIFFPQLNIHLEDLSEGGLLHSAPRGKKAHRETRAGGVLPRTRWQPRRRRPAQGLPKG